MFARPLKPYFRSDVLISFVLAGGAFEVAICSSTFIWVAVAYRLCFRWLKVVAIFCLLLYVARLWSTMLRGDLFHHFNITPRWSLKTNSETSCTLDIKVGVHFKKWCIMQSKINSGAVDEYKKEMGQMLDVAKKYLQKSNISSKEDAHEA